MTLDKIPIWLDCDPGHDDAVAILLACFHPSIELLGVSTVYGNTSVKNTTFNAQSVLTALNMTHIPVYEGAGKPLKRSVHLAPSIHGESGLDGTNLLPVPSVAVKSDLDVVDAIHKAVVSHDGFVSLVATGTLTNMYELFTRYPADREKINYLSIMGGAIDSGNWTPYAEFNIWCDPHAAKAIFTDPILSSKLIVAPLNLTHQAVATKQIAHRLLNGEGEGKSNIRQLFYELIVFFAETYEREQGFKQGPPVHDPLAVAVLLSMYKQVDLGYVYKRWRMDVVEDGEKQGQTVALEECGDGVIVGQSMDMEKFWNLVFAALSEAEKVSDL